MHKWANKKKCRHCVGNFAPLHERERERAKERERERLAGSEEKKNIYFDCTQTREGSKDYGASILYKIYQRVQV